MAVRIQDDDVDDIGDGASDGQATRALAVLTREPLDLAAPEADALLGRIAALLLLQAGQQRGWRKRWGRVTHRRAARRGFFFVDTGALTPRQVACATSNASSKCSTMWNSICSFTRAGTPRGLSRCGPAI